MASFYLLPDGINTGNTNNWNPPGLGVCGASNVSLDNGDTDYCRENIGGHQVTFTFSNPTVFEGSIDSINFVRAIVKARYTHSSGTTLVRNYVESDDGTISTPTIGFMVAASGTYSQYTSSDITTYDGSNDWTYAKLQDIEFRCLKAGDTYGRTQLRYSYIALLVDYDVAAGYGHHVMGVDAGDIAEVNGIPTANISKVNGV